MSKSRLQHILSDLQREVERVEKQSELENQLDDCQSALAAMVRNLRYGLRGTEDAIKFAEKDGYLPVSLIRWEERRDLFLELIQEAKYYKVTEDEFNRQEVEEK